MVKQARMLSACLGELHAAPKHALFLVAICIILYLGNDVTESMVLLFLICFENTPFLVFIICVIHRETSTTAET
jgi:hypothetical protein